VPVNTSVHYMVLPKVLIVSEDDIIVSEEFSHIDGNSAFAIESWFVRCEQTLIDLCVNNANKIRRFIFVFSSSQN
jgi:hypothetical protein